MLKLPQIDNILYSGPSKSRLSSFEAGDLLGEAAILVYRDAPKSFFIHAIHCYFVGNEYSKTPTFVVKNVRDGRNFAIRHVDILRPNGDAMAVAEFSLQRDVENPVISVFPEFPRNVLAPEHFENGRNSDCVEFRRVPNAINGKHYIWIRCKTPIDDSDPFQKHAILIKLSDLQLYGNDIQTRRDHSIWLHQTKFDAADWLLYEYEFAGKPNPYCLVNANIWSRDGKILMSTSQEVSTTKTRSKM
ncbi:unnamed protein product [Caenorhabditis bovis]|uniref:Cyclic nucleotide-binding domain-containing protein n=1 Tax=Caenorhabditis bovis TaxID=2654633 RepID=A0A8S1F9X2_9PELO|nr:unnamed protein product [Caenorhabditis bovis]